MAEEWRRPQVYTVITALSIGFISAAADGSSSLLSGTTRLFNKKGLFFMLYTVYILYSPVHQKHYTGFTSDLEQRLRSHNELGKGWTSKYRPWQLIYTKEFADKPEALDYEKWLKSGVGRRFIQSLPH